MGKQTWIVKNLTGCKKSARVSMRTNIRGSAIFRESSNENIRESASENVRASANANMRYGANVTKSVTEIVIGRTWVRGSASVKRNAMRREIVIEMMNGVVLIMVGMYQMRMNGGMFPSLVQSYRTIKSTCLV